MRPSWPVNRDNENNTQRTLWRHFPLLMSRRRSAHDRICFSPVSPMSGISHVAPLRTILWLHTEFSVHGLDKQAVFKIHTSFVMMVWQPWHTERRAPVDSRWQSRRQNGVTQTQDGWSCPDSTQVDRDRSQPLLLSPGLNFCCSKHGEKAVKRNSSPKANYGCLAPFPTSSFWAQLLSVLTERQIPPKNVGGIFRKKNKNKNKNLKLKMLLCFAACWLSWCLCTAEDRSRIHLLAWWFQGLPLILHFLLKMLSTESIQENILFCQVLTGIHRKGFCAACTCSFEM